MRPTSAIRQIANLEPVPPQRPQWPSSGIDPSGSRSSRQFEGHCEGSESANVGTTRLFLYNVVGCFHHKAKRPSSAPPPASSVRRKGLPTRGQPFATIRPSMRGVSRTYHRRFKATAIGACIVQRGFADDGARIWRCIGSDLVKHEPYGSQPMPAE
jgi:hypothetical protein